MSMDDKISRLPQHILHHILCFLSQEEAVQTSVLSKSWRYLGSTRPKVEFRRLFLQDDQEADPWAMDETLHQDHQEADLSVMDEILQRYHDQKLSIQQFIVKINYEDPRIFLLLEKWVPIVVTNMGAKTLNLDLQCDGDMDLPDPIFVLPSAVFQAAEFLEELYLRECKLNRIECTDKLLLKRLRKVSLIEVYLEDETFEKIISSCPLIQYLVMDTCMGLRTIRLNNNNNLKHFEFHRDSTNKNCSIEIGHVPSLETIRVYGCPNWFDPRRLYFAHLKSLCLRFVRLSTTKSFDIFSSNFPSLEDLTLHCCNGFQEFKLSSRSIKRLAITNSNSSKATIDAPNILYFKYSSLFLPSSISFAATCSHEWESYIDLCDVLGDVDSSDDRGGSSSWLHKINEVVKAFSQSKISLHLSQLFPYRNLQETVLLDNSTYTELVVVEQLTLESHSPQSLAALMKCLFRIFRPRYIIIVESHRLSNDVAKRYVESLNKILIAERGGGTQFWPQDLEDMIMEDTNMEDMIMEDMIMEDTNMEDMDFEEEWEPVKIGFRLKWKETEILS